MRFFKMAHPAPVPEDRKCIDLAIRLIQENPGWKLVKGPPEPKNLFWPQDTAHFWTVDEHGNVHDPTADRYPGYDYSKGSVVQIDSGAPYDTRFPKARDKVAGFDVGSHVPNTDSIAASLTDYKILPGIREIPLSEFDESRPYSKEGWAKVRRLMSEIGSNKRIDPLIVVVDIEGAYVLEGGHRLAALQLMKIPTLPAMIVVDMEDI